MGLLTPAMLRWSPLSAAQRGCKQKSICLLADAFKSYIG